MTYGEKIITFTKERNKILHECVTSDEAHKAIDNLTDFPKIEKIWLDPKNELKAREAYMQLIKTLHDHLDPRSISRYTDKHFCPSCIYEELRGGICGDDCWYAIVNGQCNTPDSTYKKLVDAMGANKTNTMSRAMGKEWCIRLLSVLE